MHVDQINQTFRQTESRVFDWVSPFQPVFTYEKVNLLPIQEKKTLVPKVSLRGSDLIFG